MRIRLAATVLAVAALPGLAGCASRQETTRMVDPRTGVSVICEPGSFTPPPGRTAVQLCMEELRYYGFRDPRSPALAAAPPPAPAVVTPARPIASPPPDSGAIDTGPFGKGPVSPGY